jgi:L-ascorbate metabolism protein UlaG (beta-lactamase superfamily)
MTVLQRAEKVGGKFQNPVETRVGGLSMMFKILPLYLTNKEERVPRHPLGPFQTDISVYRQVPPSGLRITWLGHSSMLMEIDGARILVDPVWDKRASPISFIGPKRFFEAPLAISDLPPLDAVLISHDHYDHLGKDTVRRLAEVAPRWVTSTGVGQELRGFGVPAGKIVELNWTESVEVSETLTITALPARHFSGRSLATRFETLWSSFVLKSARHNIYFGADSGLWDGFSEIARAYGPFELTMLEIGAYNELWKSIHMGPDGAAQAFTAMGESGLLMPIHWGLFDLALHAWRQPIERVTELADNSAIKLWSPEPGVPTDVEAGQEHRSAWWKQR